MNPPTLNDKMLSERFWQEGYPVLEDFFAADLMDRLNELIMDHFGESPAFLHNDEFLEKSKADVIPWFAQQEGVKEFDPVGDDPERFTSDV